MTKSYDFNKELLDAAGEPVASSGGDYISCADLLSDYLSQTTNAKLGIVKMVTWAIDLRKGGVINLDDQDRDALVRFIQEELQCSVLVRYRLTEILKD